MRKVGEILQEARLRRGNSLEEVEKAIKIRRAILEALESGEWHRLPPPTFIKGFIRNYGEYLGLNPNELLAFFRREYDEKKNPKVVPASQAPKKGFRLTLPVVLAGFIFLGVAIVSFYLYTQYVSFTGAPLLEVKEPQDNLKTSAREVSVVGRTYSDANLKINGQEVTLAPGGAFSVAVSLVEGVNELVITSSNRFGKISTVKKEVVVSAPEITTVPTREATPAATLVSDQPLKLVINIGPSSSWIHVETDGNLGFEGVLVQGSTRIFEAKEVIKLITGNAGSTKVSFNNSHEETVGADSQRVEKEFKK